MQEFWGLRLAALIIDVIFITLLLWILTALIYPLIAWTGGFAILNFWLLLWGIITLLYFTIMEGKWCTTLGKGLFKFKVRSDEGEMNYKKALLRNLSKFLIIPLVVDIAVGFRAEKETKKRYLDHFAGTRVVKSGLK
ncbi:MAG: RDD family protein [Methanobacteriaceae archaeon]|nr:RDD family protein [Methanobacteriaceae archaeon]